MNEEEERRTLFRIALLITVGPLVAIGIVLGVAEWRS